MPIDHIDGVDLLALSQHVGAEIPYSVAPWSLAAVASDGGACGLTRGGRWRGGRIGAHGGNGCSYRFDLCLQHIRARCLGVAFADEIRHRVEKVYSGINHRQFALQFGQLRVDVLLDLPQSGQLLLLGSIDLLLNGQPLRVQLVLLLTERLLRRDICGTLPGTRLAAQEFRVGPSDIKCQSDYFVGRLPVGKEDQLITGLSGVLLLSAKRSVPIDRVIQDLDDLGPGQHRYMRLRGGARGRITRIRRVSASSINAEGGKQGDYGLNSHGSSLSLSRCLAKSRCCRSRDASCVDSEGYQLA